MISPTPTYWIECTFSFPLIQSQVYLIWWLTSDILRCQNTRVIAFYTLKYEVLNREDKCFYNKVTILSTFCSFGPFGSNWLCLMNIFTITPTPSQGPLSWLVLKKLQSIVHPPIKYGYLLTKNHGFLLLN